MSLTIERESLGALARGFSLFGSGGGGSTGPVELMVQQRAQWPLHVADLADLPPDTPCFAPAVAGATMLFNERLPGIDGFAPLIATAERWLGRRIPAVCSAEGGGMNGLVPLLFSPERTVVDADCSGRAVPSLDQFSLLIDRVPGIIVVADTGAGGIMLMQSERPADVEKMVRAALIQAGGVGNVLLAGFTVGDLRNHAIPQHMRRALTIGARSLGALQLSGEGRSAALGARFLGSGRVSAVKQEAADEHVRTIRLSGDQGQIFRLVVRSEFLAFLHDGETVAAAPECIVAIDPLTNEPLETTAIVMNRKLEVHGIPVDDWWYAKPHRSDRIAPREYSLTGLQPHPQPESGASR